MKQKTPALPSKPGYFWLQDFDCSWTMLNADAGLAVLGSVR
jgi:hypothetical protein